MPSTDHSIRSRISTKPRSRHNSIPLLIILLITFSSTFSLAEEPDINRYVIEKSQAVLGNEVSNGVFVDTQGNPRELSEFLGKPTVISLIYSSCVHSCSITTRHINRVVQIARNALGFDSFTLLSIGFDYPTDTPENMAHYAKRHGVTDPNWHFLSADNQATVDRIINETGFHFVETASGYDHTVQLTVLDAQGKIFRQVYGELFDSPLLVEPLKRLVLGSSEPSDGFLTHMTNRVRFFCTVYDAKADRYYFDYSLFMGILAGLLVLITTGIWLAREIRFSNRRNSS